MKLTASAGLLPNTSDITVVSGDRKTIIVRDTKQVITVNHRISLDSVNDLIKILVKNYSYLCIKHPARNEVLSTIR